MTVKKRVDVHCDWPHAGGSHEGCPESDWQYGGNGSALRKQLAGQGWLQVAELDFCGLGRTEEYPYRTTPYPNHAALLEGHTFTPVEEASRIFRRKLPACSCGWVCPVGAVHIATFGKDSAFVHRGSAAKVWLDLHVREDIAGLPPRWSEERIQATNQRMAAYDAEHGIDP